MFHTLLVQPLFNLLVLIYAAIPGHDFGVAVIILTILVRLTLWPLVNKQLHSQRAMQSLAPEIAKVRKEAKGDKQKESALLMELYKEKGVNPLASLVPTFIQLPLLFALFFVLQDILKPGEIANVTYPALRGLEAVKNIIADSSAFKATLFGMNIAKPSMAFAAFAAAIQFVQTRQIMPKHTDDSSAMTNKVMMYLFPGMTFVFGLQLPAALAVYWAFTSLVAIVQQHLILRKDVEEMEAKK
jgi:YidC/Oxa1 family membrane protein insertase